MFFIIQFFIMQFDTAGNRWRKYLKGYHFFFNKETENELMARGVSNDE